MKWLGTLGWNLADSPKAVLVGEDLLVSRAPVGEKRVD